MKVNRFSAVCMFAACFVFGSSVAGGCRADSLAAVGPNLTVDVTADRHPISPFIYGLAYPDPALAREIRLPINRWGGDATTRYNWQVDSSNSRGRLVLHGGRQ